MINFIMAGCISVELLSCGRGRSFECLFDMVFLSDDAFKLYHLIDRSTMSDRMVEMHFASSMCRTPCKTWLTLHPVSNKTINF